MLRVFRNLAIALGTAAVCVAIVYFSIPTSNTRQSRFDVILVLGNRTNRDGTISDLGKSRVLEAIRQYRAGAAPRILMSGGMTRRTFVESQEMARFAEEQGVPAAAILTEQDSLSTLQNAYYSYRILQAHGWDSALIVSSPSHLRRASLIFRYYPIAWRMQPAAWPPDLSFGRRMESWCREALVTCYVRIAGYPEERRYLPRQHLTLPRL
jgi:uncharacterized SAM-binding protein YcdF (DUF218 family)